MWYIRTACFIRPANNQNIQFTIIYDVDKHQIVTFEKLNPENFGEISF